MTVLIPRMKRRSRYLFEWSARDCIERGSLDALSGQVAAYTRAGVATSIGSDGRVSAIAHSQPRFLWADLDGDGVRETPGLLIEPSSTNLVVQSDAMATGWATSGTLTPVNAVGVWAGRPFSSLANTHTGDCARSVTLTGDGVKACRWLFKASGPATTGFSQVGVYDNTASAFVANFRYTVAASGVITAVAITGTLLRVEALGDGVYAIVGLTAPCTAAHANSIYANAQQGVTTLSSVLASGIQVENSVFPSSLIPTTTATVTRQDESLSFPFSELPDSITIYTRYTTLAPASASAPIGQRLGGISNSGSSIANLLHGNGLFEMETAGIDGDTGASVAASNPLRGDVVEVAGWWNAAWTGPTTQASFSVNGSAVTSSAVFTGMTRMPFAWSDPNIHIGELPGESGSKAPRLVHAFRVSAGIRTLQQMREGA